jgi:diacylglycerol O-acyltransferase-1
MIAAIVSLKLISFIHFNCKAKTIADMIRKKQPLGQLGNIDEFVNNEIENNANNISKIITVYRFGYFILAPTLCYQLDYPRNLYIRKVWLLKRIGEFMICGLLMNIIIVQNIVTKLEDMRQFYIS